jgi:hypothetical protein
MNDGFAQSYLMITGLLFNIACLSLAVIEIAKIAFKAYYRARQEVIDVAMGYESTKEFQLRQRLVK